MLQSHVPTLHFEENVGKSNRNDIPCLLWMTRIGFEMTFAQKQIEMMGLGLAIADFCH